MATPKYDTIDWSYRAEKGGDGVPLQRGRLEHPPSDSTGSSEGGVKVIESEDEFDKYLSQSDRTFVAEFNASWCKNCKKISPTVHNLAELYSSTTTVLDIDIDDNEDLAASHSVSAIPRLIAFRNGSKVDEYLGSSIEDVTAFFARISTR